METTLTLNRPELLDVNKHDRAGFSCGVKDLDVFLHEKARKESPELSRTFVVTCVERPAEILGYFSLSSTNLRADDLPENVRKKLPRYDVLGATLLGRLAVAEKYQHGAARSLRLGELLLVDAELRTWTAAQSVASYGLVVKAVENEKGDPTSFYEHYGFIRCQHSKSMLYLPMKTIEGTLRQAGLIP